MAGTWIGFATMCIGMFMAILDVQVVATSLPTIQSALAISPELRVEWRQEHQPRECPFTECLDRQPVTELRLDLPVRRDRS